MKTNVDFFTAVIWVVSDWTDSLHKDPKALVQGSSVETYSENNDYKGEFVQAPANWMPGRGY